MTLTGTSVATAPSTTLGQGNRASEALFVTSTTERPGEVVRPATELLLAAEKTDPFGLDLLQRPDYLYELSLKKDNQSDVRVAYAAATEIVRRMMKPDSRPSAMAGTGCNSGLTGYRYTVNTPGGITAVGIYFNKANQLTKVSYLYGLKADRVDIQFSDKPGAYAPGTSRIDVDINNSEKHFHLQLLDANGSGTPHIDSFQ